MKSIFITLFLLLSIGFSFAQSGNISGKLKTADQKNAEFVNLGLKGTSFFTQSDLNGNFQLTAIPAGDYTLCVMYIGLEPIEVKVSVKENETTQLATVVLKESALQLQEIVVTGIQNANEKTVSVGKIDIKPMDLPQSVASIDKDILDQQQTQNMSDALKNFNGVYLMGTTGGVQQEIAARGFAFTNSNTFKNGVRFNNAVMPEMTALERVEVMKGSSAILFGNVSAGGVINLVTKKPTFTQGGELSMRMGSYGFYKPSIDVYGTFDQSKRVAYRLNTVYEKAQSFRDQVNSERIYFNPSVIFKLSKKTEVLVEADYLNDKRTCDFGVGSLNYQLISVPRERFMGAAWSYYNTEQKSITASVTHRFNSNWQLKSTSSAQLFNNDLFGTTRPNANNQFIADDGKWIRGVQRIMINEEYYLTQVDLSGKFSTGFLAHQLLIGSDADRYSTVNTAYNNLNTYDSINVFDLNRYKQRNDMPDLTRKTSTSSPIKRLGFYAQDLITVSAKLKVLAGMRLSYIETGSSVLTYASYSTTTTKQVDFAKTPRLGLVYQPSKKLSLFGSYANSFTPNSGVDITGKALAPSYFTQYEAGVKSMLFKNLMSANLTVYQIINSNMAQTSLVNGNTNTNIKELDGEVTSKGIELDVMSKSVCGFILMAGYSYNETKYTKSNTYIEGSLLRYNPKHTANSSLFYNINRGKLKGLSAGISYLYFGERQAGRSTRITVSNDPYKLFTLPAYSLLDASVGFVKNGFSIRFKISNILNSLSYNVHDDNSVNPIAPRQWSTTLSYKF